MADVAMQPIAVEEQPAIRPWPLGLRFLFRLGFCYWLIFWTWIAGNIPGAQFVLGPYEKLWQAVCPWVAIHVLHLSGPRTTYIPTGSGDTTLGFIRFGVWLVVSLAATLVWSVLDRRRKEYRTLHGWLRLLLRYALSAVLLGYGFAKVFPLQFQPARLARLMEPYGEFSPMGVLWNFMGASQPYTVFSGIVESLGGVLLWFRRTTSLGAMCAFTVMLNIVAMNFFYDVPVKLHSSQYLLMAICLLLPDVRRLASVLVFNRPAPAANLPAPEFQRRWLQIGSRVFWVLFIGYALFTNIQSSLKRYDQSYIHPPRAPIYGLYRVEGGAPAGWSKMAFDFPASIPVRMINDEVEQFKAEYDAAKSTVKLAGKSGSGSLVWSQPDPSHLVLTGTFAGAPVAIHLRRIDTELLLRTRGFHWIQELPFNR
jgi:hypothetical protein